MKSNLRGGSAKKKTLVINTENIEEEYMSDNKKEKSVVHTTPNKSRPNREILTCFNIFPGKKKKSKNGSSSDSSDNSEYYNSFLQTLQGQETRARGYSAGQKSKKSRTHKATKSEAELLKKNTKNKGSLFNTMLKKSLCKPGTRNNINEKKKLPPIDEKNLDKLPKFPQTTKQKKKFRYDICYFGPKDKEDNPESEKGSQKLKQNSTLNLVEMKRIDSFSIKKEPLSIQNELNDFSIIGNKDNLLTLNSGVAESEKPSQIIHENKEKNSVVLFNKDTDRESIFTLEKKYTYSPKKKKIVKIIKKEKNGGKNQEKNNEKIAEKNAEQDQMKTEQRETEENNNGIPVSTSKKNKENFVVQQTEEKCISEIKIKKKKRFFCCLPFN